MNHEISIRRLDISVEDVDTTLLIAEFDSKWIGFVEIKPISRRSASFRKLYVDQDARFEGLIQFYEACGYFISYQFEDGSLTMTKLLK